MIGKQHAVVPSCIACPGATLVAATSSKAPSQTLPSLPQAMTSWMMLLAPWRVDCAASSSRQVLRGVHFAVHICSEVDSFFENLQEALGSTLTVG